jgi:hypothetical protein
MVVIAALTSGLLIAALVVIALTSSGEPTGVRPSAEGSRSPAASAPPSAETAPVRCGSSGPQGCFPNLSISRDMLAPLQSQGFQCEADGSYQKRCVKRAGSLDQLTVNVSFDRANPDKLTEVSVTGASSANGYDPPDKSAAAHQRTTESLQTALRLALPKAPHTQQNILAWARQTLGKCPISLSENTVFSGFQVRCRNSSPPIAVNGPRGPVTTWAGVVSVAAPGLMR